MAYGSDGRLLDLAGCAVEASAWISGVLYATCPAPTLLNENTLSALWLAIKTC